MLVGVLAHFWLDDCCLPGICRKDCACSAEDFKETLFGLGSADWAGRGDPGRASARHSLLSLLLKRVFELTGKFSRRRCRVSTAVSRVRLHMHMHGHGSSTSSFRSVRRRQSCAAEAQSLLLISLASLQQSRAPRPRHPPRRPFVRLCSSPVSCSAPPLA